MSNRSSVIYDAIYRESLFDVGGFHLLLLDSFLSWKQKYAFDTAWIVLAAVQVWPARTGRFGFRPGQQPDPLSLGGTNLDPYLSSRGVCPVWLDQSVTMSGSAFRVFRFLVALRYSTVNCKIFTLV